MFGQQGGDEIFLSANLGLILTDQAASSAIWNGHLEKAEMIEKGKHWNGSLYIEHWEVFLTKYEIFLSKTQSSLKSCFPTMWRLMAITRPPMPSWWTAIVNSRNLSRLFLAESESEDDIFKNILVPWPSSWKRVLIYNLKICWWGPEHQGLLLQLP